MKAGRKFLSIWLTVVMILALGVTVFAANTNSHTIIITHDKSGHTYTAYQVFKGDISDIKLTNIEWGEGVKGDKILEELKGLENSPYAKCSTAEDVAKILKDFRDNSKEIDIFANIVNKYLSESTAGSANTSSQNGEKHNYSINVTGDGYYFIKDTGTLQNENDGATKYILKVVNDVTINAKPEIPTLDKMIVKADDTTVKGTAQDVGSVVEFKLTSKVPDMTEYDSYQYIITDTMSKGLTPVLKENTEVIDVKITIGDTNYDNFSVEMDNTYKEGSKFTITFNNFISQKDNAGKDIVITYKAKINENALKTDKETNTASLEYSNNPNDKESKGKTPDKTVYVYDFDIVIDKYTNIDTTNDNTTEKKLKGAKFVLKKKDNNSDKYYSYDDKEDKVEWVTLAENETVEKLVKENKITEVITDDNGSAKFYGLDAGTYFLEETQAPDGYNKLTEDVKVIITIEYNDDGTIKSKSVENSKTNVNSINNGQYSYTQKVLNQSGSQLPSTGGRGTTLFYIIGGILAVGAAVLLIVKKRMDVEE